MFEKYVKQSRAKKRAEFGEIGVHEDCVHYGLANGKPYCKCCTYWTDGHNYTRRKCILRCQKGVCYHYEPKRKENSNENQSNA